MPPYFLSFRTALAVRACPAFAEALSRAKGKSKGICFPEFSAAYSSRAAKARLVYSPDRAPRRRVRLTRLPIYDAQHASQLLKVGIVHPIEYELARRTLRPR